MLESGGGLCTNPGSLYPEAVRYRVIIEFMTAVEQVSIEALSGTQRSISIGGHCRTLHLTTAVEQKPLRFGQVSSSASMHTATTRQPVVQRNPVDQRRSVDTNGKF